MSEPEKKGSPWPWVLVPIAAIIMFFVLRECRQHLPPAPDHAPAPAASVPSTTAPQAETPAPEPAPAPQ